MLRKDVTKGSPTTVGATDRTEIARFDALAEEWWKPDDAFKVVHAFNRVRVGHIAERLPALLQRDPRERTVHLRRRGVPMRRLEFITLSQAPQCNHGRVKLGIFVSCVVRLR
jgi:2-polyprenyl-3-methyl-5-hydroxy-6-metoxy-1,4-benzoquinol methylase